MYAQQQLRKAEEDQPVQSFVKAGSPFEIMLRLYRQKIAIPNVLREVFIDDLRASQTGTWGMLCMATPCWLPCMNREFIVRSTKCEPCSAFSKNLKSKTPAKQLQLHISFAESNQKIRIDFGGPICDENGHEI